MSDPITSSTETEVLPCWRGCPLDVGTGLRKHQWPCEFSGQTDVVGSPASKITTGWHSHPTHGRGDALDQVLTFEAKGSGR